MSIPKFKKLRIRELQVGSAMSGVFFFIFAVAYSAPNEFVRMPPMPTPGQAPRVNIVSFIEQLTIFPLWTVLFALSWGLCVIASARDKFGPKSHAISGSIMLGYAVASIITAVVNPGTYIVTATFALAFSFAQFMLMSTYVHRQEKITHELAGAAVDRQEYVDTKRRWRRER